MNKNPGSYERRTVCQKNEGICLLDYKKVGNGGGSKEDQQALLLQRRKLHEDEVMDCMEEKKG